MVYKYQESSQSRRDEKHFKPVEVFPALPDDRWWRPKMSEFWQDIWVFCHLTDGKCVSLFSRHLHNKRRVWCNPSYSIEGLATFFVNLLHNFTLNRITVEIIDCQMPALCDHNHPASTTNSNENVKISLIRKILYILVIVLVETWFKVTHRK